MGLPAADKNASAQTLEAGRKIFEQRCATCHGGGGDGGEMGPPIALRLPALSDHDLQLLTDDKRVHLLRRAGERYREVTSTADWPTYNGDPGGNRHSTLTQIDKTTVTRLAPRWVFSIGDAG